MTFGYSDEMGLNYFIFNLMFLLVTLTTKKDSLEVDTLHNRELNVYASPLHVFGLLPKQAWSRTLSIVSVSFTVATNLKSLAVVFSAIVANPIPRAPFIDSAMVEVDDRIDKSSFSRFRRIILLRKEY